MKKRFKNIQQYQTSWSSHGKASCRRLFEEWQNDVLFIACADSRVVSDRASHSRLGELFLLHMDIIDHFDEGACDRNISAPVLKFALSKTPITDIIVCGYSNCGSGHLTEASHLLRQQIVQEQILAQLRVISSCQVVQRAIEDGVLSLHGWYYDKNTGKGYDFNSFTSSFEEIVFI